jgi:hypothetical protein
VISNFADLARDVLAAEPRVGTVRLVAVDGPAGSGKTTFGASLACALVATGAAVGQVSVDDLRNGWADIVDWWPRFDHEVLTPLAYGRAGSYRRYDWGADRFAPVEATAPVVDVLILDGVGSASTAAAGRLTYSVWVCAGDPAMRLARLIARDGEALAPELARWMADETAYFVTDRTAERADLCVDGTAALDPGQFEAYIGDTRNCLMG